MPRRKKTAKDMADKELESRVFPKKVLEELQRIAHENDDEEDNQPSQEESNT